MDCVESIVVLSEYHDGALDELSAAQVREHLLICIECHGIFRDLEVIITQASVLRDAPGLAFPDETVIWQRMSFIKRAG
ncbi:MAG: zf-HC2 domain-containing protein [Pyrinomonadaceae bacterium]|nr:zf-HC2 domain-containing protein [Acidobacteriota bacterium]